MKYNILLNEIITTDGYLELCNELELDLCHIKTDYFYKGNFIWRGESHPSSIKKNVIISHSDYDVTDQISKKFNLVFCVNNNSNNTNTFSLPIGIPNNNEELEILKIIGEKKSFVEVANSDVEKQHLLYLNFTKSTNFSVRNKIYELYKEKKWVYLETPNISEKGRYDYLMSLKKSKFVICPPGNGLDTHRLWESLYMGAIPIIQNIKTHDVCEGLPVLFTENWEELTEDYLNNVYLTYQNRSFNMKKLNISYWRTYIKNKINNN